MLKGLADELLATYHTSQSVPALEKAISIYEKVLQLRPLGHVCRAESLNDLGYAILHFCLDHETDQTRSNRCNELLREALCLRPPGHPLRDESLHNLARSLRSMLWQNLGGLDMLMECASLNREAVLLRLPGHPERAKSLNNLANDLTMIVEHTGDIEVLAEVVGMRREVLWLRPPGNPLRGSSLNNLALALCLHFEHLGGSELLAEAIDVTRDAMQLSPVGHPLRFSVLDSLAYALMIRSNHEGHSHSLSEANACMREALQMLSDHHPERSRVMGNLSGSLLSIFRSNGDRRALGEAIRLQREAVTLRSAGGYGHDDALDNLAEALEAKFDAENDTEALVEASSLHRETLRLRPIGHWRRFRSLEGLARVLCRLGCDSWPETLARYQEALELCPVGYPDRVRLLSGMSRCFLDQSSPSFSPSEGTLCLSKAYADPFTHVSRRLNSAILDLRKLEEAYDAYTKQAQIGSRIQDDDRVLDLYTQVISLLPLAANLGLDHVARLQAVTGCDEITRNAAARAMLRGCLPQAVEMLEQGRGVFWTQTLRLRTTAFENVPEDDCHELQRILRLLEHGARRAESSEQSADKRDRALEQRRQLNEAVQALISKIREYPGLDRFLLLPAFDALFGSLPDGFVVIVNASRLGHHALLLHRTTGLANSLALKPFRAGFDGASLGAQLPRDMASAPERDDDNETRAIRIKSGKIRCFEDVLSLLWTSVVQPIFNALGLNVRVKIMK
jgi:tetratricopeptide (TPR) repeat protein